MIEKKKLTGKHLIKILLSIHSNPFSVKVVFTVVIFAVFAYMIVIAGFKTYITDLLHDQMVQKGQAIAAEAVHRSTEYVLRQEVQPLSEIAGDISSKYSDVDYVIILDKDGQLLAHDSKANVSSELLKLYSTRKLEKGENFEIIEPVGEEIGWIKIGMSVAFISETIGIFSKDLLNTTILLTIFGVLGSLIIAHLVTRPIIGLSLASKKIAEGDFSQRVTTWGNDQIAQLGKTFNQMASSIEKYTIERETLIEILKQNEQIRQELLKKVMTAQEDERKRISRELHDETSQSLTSLIIGLKLLKDESRDDHQIQSISALKDLASDTLEEVHRLALELRPTVLDDMGLIPAIERFVSGYSSTYQIDVDFHVQHKDRDRLPGEVETALYRIVQEALTNTAKYSQAMNVSILLDIRKEGVKMIVEDDGCGFDVDKIMRSEDKHLGVAGMKERTLLLGGEFTIESAEGQGTTAFVRIPLERREGNGSTD